MEWWKLGALAIAFAALLVIAVAQWTGRRRRLFWVEVLIALLSGVAAETVLGDWWRWI